MEKFRVVEWKSNLHKTLDKQWEGGRRGHGLRSLLEHMDENAYYRSTWPDVYDPLIFHIFVYIQKGIGLLDQVQNQELVWIGEVKYDGRNGSFRDRMKFLIDKFAPLAPVKLKVVINKWRFIEESQRLGTRNYIFRIEKEQQTTKDLLKLVNFDKYFHPSIKDQIKTFQRKRSRRKRGSTKKKKKSKKKRSKKSKIYKF
jgi:peptidoglycan hydrolase-like protein with peptidoglycan-binding domain